MKNQDRLDNSLKYIAKSSIIVLISLFLSKLFTYVYRIIIARSPEFGPETYGLFSLAVMITTIAVSIFSLGFGGGLLRYIAFYRGKKETKKISYIINLSFKVLAIASVIGSMIMFLLSGIISINFFHNSSLIPYLRWFSLIIPISIISGLYLSILQAYEKINWFYFIKNILDTGAKLFFLILFVLIGFGYLSIIYSYMLGIVLVLVISYYIYKFRLDSGITKSNALSKSETKVIRRDLFSYSWPLIFSGLVWIFFTSTDSFIIGYFKNAESVGIYNVAIPLAALLFIAPSLFIQLFLPLMTKEFANNNYQLIKETSKQISKWIFLINLPIFIILVLFPGAIINLLFGPDYISASQPLRILSIGLFFYSIFLVSDNLLSVAGKSRIILYNLIIATIINIILSITLVPKFGISGAAFSTTIVYIIWSIITMLQAKKYTGVIPLKRKMIQIFLISLIPTFLLIFIKSFFPLNSLTLILQGSLFFLLYLFLVIYFGGLDRNDYMIINSIKNRLHKR